jgi:SAM-dependent methyltransferase
VDNRPYFSGIQRQYHDAVECSGEGYANIGRELDRRLRGRVVDFGNGGVINYRVEQIERLLCVDVVRRDARPGHIAEFVEGDFYEFELPQGTDFALAQFLLHHLPDEARLDAALARLRRSLGVDGRFVVVEMLMPRPLEVLQAALAPVRRGALRFLRKPDLRFFSRATLVARLRGAGFARIEVTVVDVGRWMAPAPVLFPRLRMPGRLYPLTMVVIDAAAR